MDSARDLLPVFHYRNWVVRKDNNNGSNDDDDDDDDNNNDDNNNNNNDDDNNEDNDDDDDNNSLQSDCLAQSIAVAIASRQGCNATSSLGGVHRSPGSDDRHIIQWERRIDAFQEHSHMSFEASIGQELVPSSSSEQVTTNIITFLRLMNAPNEPWSPLDPPRRPLVNTSAAFMYNMLYCIGTELDAPSTYCTATSEIVTNGAFHSATSHPEGCRNDMLGTISV
jgi:hypothetical protein